MKFLKPKYIVFVILVTIGVLGALGWTSTVDAASCEWKADKPTSPAKPADGAFGFSVKTGDLTLTRDLRAAIEERLKARGLTNLVDNPVQKPRADVALEKGELRYLPFYATVHTEMKVVRTGPRGSPPAPADHLALDSTCTGVVSQSAWRAKLVEALADQAADAIAPRAP